MAVNHQRPGGHGYHNGQQSQSINQNSLTYEELWHCLVDRGIPTKSKIVRNLLNSYLICVSGKFLGHVNKSLT